MNKRLNKSKPDRMIHIRLDEKTHMKLKMHAAATKGSIQQLVESLIRDKYVKIKIKDISL